MTNEEKGNQEKNSMSRLIKVIIQTCRSAKSETSDSNLVLAARYISFNISLNESVRCFVFDAFCFDHNFASA